MRNIGQTTLSFIVGILVLALMCGVFYADCVNRAVGLEARFRAASEKTKAVHDNIARIVGAKAGVAKEYRRQLVDVLRVQVEGRKGGDMVKAITEAVPGMDPTLLRDVANAAEAQRYAFVEAETVCLATKEEHDKLRLGFPSGLVVGSRAELKYSVVTSENTEKVFSTGRDESGSDPFAK